MRFPAGLVSLELRPDFPDAYNTLGNLLRKQNQQSEALVCCERVLALAPDCRYVFGMATSCHAMMCQWADHGATQQHLLAGVQRGKGCVPPQVFLNLCDDPLEQRQFAEIWVREHYPDQGRFSAKSRHSSHDRIRLAYISPDIRSHAVAYLIADLIEQHDRSHFEVLEISIGAGAWDLWRERLTRAFEQFLGVRGESDAAIAEPLRTLEIETAVAWSQSRSAGPHPVTDAGG